MSHYLDAEQEMAVWARVMAGRQEPAPDGPDCEPEPDCCLRPEQLMEWVCHECHDVCLYHHLARCLPRAKQWLLEMAHDEQCHAKRLAAQYYVLTGCKPCFCTRFHPEAQPCELLRRQYQAELDASAAYRAAADCAEGDLACLLEELSKDEARHSRMVMCLLECVL